jgi:hypothetical protein
MLFWSELAFFSLELVSRDQFVAAIQGCTALWKAVIEEPDQERLNIFIRSLPPSCLGPKFLQSPQSLQSPQPLPPQQPEQAKVATPSRLGPQLREQRCG